MTTCILDGSSMVGGTSNPEGAVNRSTRFSPFQVVHSLVPRAPTDLSTLLDRQRLHGVAETFMEQLVETHVQTNTNLEASVSKYKSAVDAHRRRLIFDVGDLGRI